MPLSLLSANHNVYCRFESQNDFPFSSVLLLQLVIVQQKMHASLQLYYKYRGLYTVSELARMQSESKNSAIQLAELQQRIDETVKSMAQFVQSQVDNDSRTVARDVVNDDGNTLLINSSVDTRLNTDNGLMLTMTSTA